MMHAVFSILVTFAQGLKNGLDAVPPMGFNTWESWACDISEAKVHQAADSMVATGLRDAGYVFLNLDGKLGFNLPVPAALPPLLAVPVPVLAAWLQMATRLCSLSHWSACARCM